MIYSFKNFHFTNLCDTNFLRLMSSYLKSRTLVVSVNEIKSNVAEISSGVPRGSTQGPLLFLIFINDLPLVLSRKVSSIVCRRHYYL